MSFVDAVFQSLVSPTPTLPLLRAMNLTFFALFLTLLGLIILVRIYQYEWNLHVIFLTAITALLWLSINWFVQELVLAQGQPVRSPDTSSSPPLDRREKSKLD
ncbi:hypothetical protein BT69DRAFT_1329023 [Atractiella rhizophila]|nr:hypothetical protein BT69DRAFT_1329023 [Atractiella rhizophila]